MSDSDARHINLQEVTYVSRRHRFVSHFFRFRGSVPGSQVLKVYARMFHKILFGTSRHKNTPTHTYTTYAFSRSNRLKMHLSSSALTSFAARPKCISQDKNFEVRHPRCVNQITNMADEQSKHNYIALLGTTHIGPGPQPNCSRAALLRTLLSRALCICNTRINVSPFHIILWRRSRHQQQTHFILYSYFITRGSTTWRWPI